MHLSQIHLANSIFPFNLKVMGTEYSNLSRNTLQVPAHNFLRAIIKCIVINANPTDFLSNSVYISFWAASCQVCVRAEKKRKKGALHTHPKLCKWITKESKDTVIPANQQQGGGGCACAQDRELWECHKVSNRTGCEVIPPCVMRDGRTQPKKRRSENKNVSFSKDERPLRVERAADGCRGCCVSGGQF